MARSKAGESTAVPLPLAPKSRTLNVGGGAASAWVVTVATAPAVARASVAVSSTRGVLVMRYPLKPWIGVAGGCHPDVAANIWSPDNPVKRCLSMDGNRFPGARGRPAFARSARSVAMCRYRGRSQLRSAAMTDLRPPLVSGARPIVGHIPRFMRDPVAVLERGHREHGSVFSLKLGPTPTVVLLGTEHHRFFFSETDRRLSIRAAYPFFVRMFDAGFYFFGGPDEYRRQRALVLPRFQGRQLAGYIGAMAEQTRQVQHTLGERGEFDLIDTLGPLVMRIAAHAFLGPELGGRLDMDFFERFRRFSGGMEQVLPLWLPIPRLIRARRARDDLRRLVGALIQQRRERPADPPDFLQTLVAARYDDGERVPDLVLVNLILMLTWAGHETTAGHVSWALIDLLQHPEELARVREEQHAVLDAGPEPDRFRPDRFAEDPRALHALAGFGGGVHRCLGVHFAYLEMKVIVSMLLHDYDLELVDPDPQPVRGTKTKWPQRPCRVRYRRRVPADVVS